MPAVNDSIPNNSSTTANTQQDTLLTDTLTVNQLQDSTVYIGKTITANEMYGVKSTLLAKTVDLSSTKEGIPREYPLGNSWAFLPMIGVILLALLLLRYTRNYFGQLFLLLISNKAAHKQYKSNLQNFNRTLLILTLFSVVPVTILGTFILNNFPNQLIVEEGYQLYLIVGGFFLAFCLFKSIVLSIAGVLTYEEGLVQELRYNSRVFAGAWGIVVLPFILLLVLNDSEVDKITFFLIIIILSILLYILYLIRSFQLFYVEKVSIFFWILYLCTLELLPALLVFNYLFPFR